MERDDSNANEWMLSYRTAWYAVTDALNRVVPGWNADRNKPAMENAVIAIVRLGTNQKDPHIEGLMEELRSMDLSPTGRKLRD